MQRDLFTFYRSFYESLTYLKLEEKAKIYDAICNYALNGAIPSLDNALQSIFILIKPNLDASRKRAENGSKGGKQTQSKAKQPKSNPQAKSSKAKQPTSNIKKEKEIKKDKELKIDKKTKKDKYGKFNNVCLTQTELISLNTDYGTELVKNTINELSLYMESTGKTYKNHCATIINFIKRNQEKERMKKIDFESEFDSHAKRLGVE